ncbi:hypothetical protein CXG81DRAFT_28889 [Caulochytrium protostelioides]|uniref:Reticulon-like protein n=1 Tax=Caulochytrium protostelioides TaxID=1555241 RepID=A0A4P9WXX3_9FUNG|nr:hypothetical protein CXG81DRAFT_28889 [Caulochytrium protostelioides]|eukprot:RKO98274.1 hypothetical protein CXG81DRAFT_28889 [Caulochytrium protostelioides]
MDTTSHIDHLSGQPLHGSDLKNPLVNPLVPDMPAPGPHDGPRTEQILQHGTSAAHAGLNHVGDAAAGAQAHGARDGAGGPVPHLNLEQVVMWQQPQYSAPALGFLLGAIYIVNTTPILTLVSSMALISLISTLGLSLFGRFTGRPVLPVASQNHEYVTAEVAQKAANTINAGIARVLYIASAENPQLSVTVLIGLALLYYTSGAISLSMWLGLGVVAAFVGPKTYVTYQAPIDAGLAHARETAQAQISRAQHKATDFYVKTFTPTKSKKN